MDLLYQFVGLILIALARESFQWRSFRIIFTSSEAKFDKDLLEVKIDIRNNSNEESVLNAKLNILQQLDDLEISYGLAMQLQTQNYTTTISRSLHLCNFFKDHSLDPFLRFIYEGLVTHGNLMKSCPIQKGVYFVREYKIDEELFPSYVPETNFLATLGISKRKKTNSVQILLIKQISRITETDNCMFIRTCNYVQHGVKRVKIEK